MKKNNKFKDNILIIIILDLKMNKLNYNKFNNLIAIKDIIKHFIKIRSEFKYIVNNRSLTIFKIVIKKITKIIKKLKKIIKKKIIKKKIIEQTIPEYSNKKLEIIVKALIQLEDQYLKNDEYFELKNYTIRFFREFLDRLSNKKQTYETIKYMRDVAISEFRLDRRDNCIPNIIKKIEITMFNIDEIGILTRHSRSIQQLAKEKISENTNEKINNLVDCCLLKKSKQEVITEMIRSFLLILTNDLGLHDICTNINPEMPVQPITQDQNILAKYELNKCNLKLYYIIKSVFKFASKEAEYIVLVGQISNDKLFDFVKICVIGLILESCKLSKSFYMPIIINEMYDYLIEAYNNIKTENNINVHKYFNYIYKSHFSF